MFSTALLALVVDQLSKYWVRQHLVYGVPWNPVSWLRPVLSFTYITNTGASFGLFPGLGRLYTVVALAVVALILLFYRRLPVDNWLLHISVGLQLGGALGNNVVDRLLRGQVTDFLDLNFWPLQEWPVFNVADSCVVVGVCILAAYLLFEKEPPEAPPETPQDAQDGNVA